MKVESAIQHRKINMKAETGVRTRQTTRRMRRLCAYGLLTISVILATTSSAVWSHANSDNHNHGLGSYGRSGVITQENLGMENAGRISNRAIELAQAPELAAARKSWSEEIDFVWQVQYQLKFRSRTDYLSSDAEHLGKVLSQKPRNVGINALQLYMTNAEAKEFNRRQRLGTRMKAIKKVMGMSNSVEESADPTYRSDFGGIWQDQMNGGAIVVASTNPSRLNRSLLKRIAGGSKNLRVIKVKHSWRKIDSFRDALRGALENAGITANVHINSTGTGRKLEIVTEHPELIDDRILSEVPTELVTVSFGEIGEQGRPSLTHAEADQTPGLQIELDPGGFCTWGINGHTNSYNYLVTAGHCGGGTYDDFSGWSGVLEVHQNNSYHLTPGRQFVYSRNRGGWDMKRVSSPQADSNCYHTVRNCQRYIKARALHNSWEIGSDIVCASLGTSNFFECGYILEENFRSSTPGCEGSRWVRYGIDTSRGDSGSGIIGLSSSPSATIDAIHACGSGTSGFGNTAYDVKTRLGFDFNCARSRVRGRAARNWGRCPAVNR